MTRARGISALLTATILGLGAWAPAASRVSVAASSGDTWIYVSPQGSDSNPGTEAAPLATLAQAQRTVRGLAGSMNGDIIVYLEPGTYRLSQPLLFTPADSGRNGFKVIWTSAPSDPAVVSGGRQISGWRLVDPARRIWAAPVPAGLRTRQIYVNGMRATLASGAVRGTVIQRSKGYQIFPNGMAGWPDASNMDFGYLAALGLWTNVICPISAVKGPDVIMAQPCWDNSTKRQENYVGWGNLVRPSFVENAYELLGKPGQFYLDGKKHVMYYVPRPGENLPTADVEAPALEALVSGAGTPGAPIHDITFSNLRFSYATWLRPNQPEGLSEIQSTYSLTGKGAWRTQGLCRYASGGTCPYGSWTQSPANVGFVYDTNLAFVNDRFVHLGAAGLALGEGSQNDLVTGSVFTDISGNGIEIGNVDLPQAKGPDQTRAITISDNHLYGMPVEFQGGVPIIVGYAANMLITHNQIDNVPYSGISIGWGGWPDKYGHPAVSNFSHDNVISDNLIYNFMQLLSDGGGIYTQGITGSSMANGEKVTGNVIHDELDWSRALQSDDGTTYVTYASNVLYNNSYDWGTNHINYSARDGTFDPQTLQGNYWEQGDLDKSDRMFVESGNTVITGPDQAPPSIVNGAGIEPAYASILDWRPAGRAVPSSPQRLKALYAFGGQVYLTWRPGFATGSGPITAYTVQTCLLNSAAYGGGCGQVTRHTVTISAADFNTLGYVVIPGLRNGKAYSFQVTETNAAGPSTPSIPSMPVKVVNGRPKRPGKPRQIAVRAAAGGVTAQWYAPGSARARYYQFAAQPVLAYVLTGSDGRRQTVTSLSQVITTNGGSKTVVPVRGLTPGKPYRFSVAAVTPAGTGKVAYSGWIRPLAPPGP